MNSVVSLLGPDFRSLGSSYLPGKVEGAERHSTAFIGAMSGHHLKLIGGELALLFSRRMKDQHLLKST